MRYRCYDNSSNFIVQSKIHRGSMNKKSQNRCEHCNCLCHCTVKEHSDLYGICSCKECKCDDPKNVGEECLSCQ